MTQPESASSKLVDRVNTLLGEARPSELVLHAIKRDAKALLRNADAFNAYLVLGMVACLERNPDETRNYHSKALNLHNNYIANLQFGTSLENLGFFSEAVIYLERAHKLAPDSKDALDKLIRFTAFSCQFQYSAQLLEKWDRLCPKEPHPKTVSTKEIATFMKEYSIPDKEAEEVQRIAIDNLVSRNIFHGGSCYFHLPSEDGVRWFEYVMKVDKTSQVLADLNSDLADIIANKVSSKIMNSVVVRYSPLN